MKNAHLVLLCCAGALLSIAPVRGDRTVFCVR